MAARRPRAPAPVVTLPAGPRSGWLVGALDPGTKPGVVQIDMTTGHIVRAATHVQEAWVTSTPWDVFVTEGQWYYGGAGRARGAGAGGRARGAPDVNDLLKLAFRAGFDLACIPAARSLRIPPQVWRTPYGNLSKEQVQKKIALDLTAAQRQLFSGIPDSRHGDVLDAIGLARWARLHAFTTTEYDWTMTP